MTTKKGVAIEDDIVLETTADSETVPHEDAPRPYELMVLFKGDMLEGKAKKKIKEIEEFITAGEGRVKVADAWDKQKLAYRIGTQTEGFYAVYNFEVKGSFMKELNQHLRIDPEILRFMIIALPAEYQYSRFEQTEEEKEEARPKRKRIDRMERVERAVSVKHTGMDAPAKKESAAAETATAEAPDAKAAQPVDESALDKKLDEILSDTDLNL